MCNTPMFIVSLPDMNQLRVHIFDVKGIPVKEVALPPRPLTPDHLYKTCAPEVSLPQSHAINESLRCAL
jgi:hypothetical protein